jgi:hypothetical protein
MTKRTWHPPAKRFTIGQLVTTIDAGRFHGAAGKVTSYRLSFTGRWNCYVAFTQTSTRFLLREQDLQPADAHPQE